MAHPSRKPLAPRRRPRLATRLALLVALIAIPAFVMAGAPAGPVGTAANDGNLIDSPDRPSFPAPPPGHVQSSQGGYSTGVLARFDVSETATSATAARELLAIEGNTFDIHAPVIWTTTSATLGLDVYSKQQSIVDPTFVQRAGTAWIDSKVQTGIGTITTSFYPNRNNPTHVSVSVVSAVSGGNLPGFRTGDRGIFTQATDVTTPDGVGIQPGRLVQPAAQDSITFGFDVNPGFGQDRASPYGGTTQPSDQVLMYHDLAARSLVLDILPDKSITGGNPSAAWWHYIDIPYVVDHARLSLTWEVLTTSSFEATDNYTVAARVNDRYIDGRGWLERTDALPYNGTATSLITYNNPAHVRHGLITRTYDITSLVDGLVGINKFDFGAWAQHPSKGEDDRMVVRFRRVEFAYQTGDKHEIAVLEFKYRATDTLGPTIPPPVSQTIVNKASLGLLLQNSTGDQVFIRTLPFNAMVTGSTWNSMIASVTQDHLSFFQAPWFTFAVGMYFERDFYEPVSREVFLDDVYFTINHGFPGPAEVGLQARAGTGSWVDVDHEPFDLDVSGWVPGDSVLVWFRSSLPVYEGRVYLNVNCTHALQASSPDAANASYAIDDANAVNGTWAVVYDNGPTFGTVLEMNETGMMSIVSYSLAVLDLPAIDGLGGDSRNWHVHAAAAPVAIGSGTWTLVVVDGSTSSFQHAVIFGGTMAGTWAILARQPNYIDACTFNNTFTYLDLPAIHRGEVLAYNASLIEGGLSGNYSLAVTNGTGHLMASYPVHFGSTGAYLAGTFPVPCDYAVGVYSVWLAWNDTAQHPGGGRAWRLGSRVVSFAILNGTHSGFVNVTSSVIAGEIATYTIFYQIRDGTGIPGATIEVFDNTTGMPVPWGFDVDPAYTWVYLGNGIYVVNLTTAGAANGTRAVLISLVKPFHQSQLLGTSLDIITYSALNVTVTWGATWDPLLGLHVLDPGNEPHVNDTGRVVRIYVEDELLGSPIAGALVTGRILPDGIVRTAIDTGGGTYELHIDATGMDATPPGQNVTFMVSVVVPGYDPVAVPVLGRILPLPLAISVTPPDPGYPGCCVPVHAAVSSIVDPGNPRPVLHASVALHIYDGDAIVSSGTLVHVISGVYAGTISFAGLEPGEYRFLVNASARNCQPVEQNVSLIVLPLQSCVLDVELPSSIRVLRPFEVTARLSDENGTGFPSKPMSVSVSIDGVDPFTFNVLSGEGGLVSFQYIIDSQHEGKQVTVAITFDGDLANGLGPATASDARQVLGKVPVQMDIVAWPAIVRAGYPASYTLRIAIDDPLETVQGKRIGFIGYANVHAGQYITPFTVQQLYTNADGNCTHAILDIMESMHNITVFFEFLGSDTLAYNITHRFDIVLPRWNASMIIQPLPAIVRYGQVIPFVACFACENASISLENLPVLFTFKYGTVTEIVTAFINATMAALLWYPVGHQFDGSLNVSIAFPGTEKVAGASMNMTIDVHPKIQVSLAFTTPVETRQVAGVRFYNVRVTGEGGMPLPGKTIVVSVPGYEVEATSNEDGIATVSLVLAIGQVRITVSFPGEAEFAPSTMLSPEIRVLDEFSNAMESLLALAMENALWLVIIAVVIVSASIARRQAAVKQRKAWRRDASKIVDIVKVRHVLVIAKDSGACIVNRSYAKPALDGDLISGFLQAITTFGKEIGPKSSEARSSIVFDYQDFKILLQDGDKVRVALFLAGPPTDHLRANAARFVSLFETRYQMDAWSGNLRMFSDVDNILEEAFEITLIYPWVVNDRRDKSEIKTRLGRALVEVGQAVQREKQAFFLTSLVQFAQAGRRESQDQVLAEIYRLKKAGFFTFYSPDA